MVWSFDRLPRVVVEPLFAGTDRPTASLLGCVELNAAI
jgi:hypothetical protein